jgi:hypothetical protein
MAALTLDRLAVWLDKLAPEGGAFAHALEWAGRLHLPLKAFLWEADLSSEQLDACERECLRQGVSWEVFRWHGPLLCGMERFLRSTELSVFGSGLAEQIQKSLLDRTLRSPPSPVLLCGPTWRPLGRILVLSDQEPAGSYFLDTVAHLCHTFQVSPVVLTVGWSEEETQQRQQQVEERLAAHRLPADFDCLIGCDRLEAVVVVARWRHCSHVIVERPRNTPWWRNWLRGRCPEALPRLWESLTVLALPGTGLAAGTAEPVQAARPLRWAWGLG